MPKAPLRPCRHPGCAGFCQPGHVYCKEHDRVLGHDALRGGAAFRGYDSKWRVARKRYLQQHPLCVKCLEEGRAVAATVVDHIIPHRGNESLFWDQRNWQPLCTPHHNEKTGRGE